MNEFWASSVLKFLTQSFIGTKEEKKPNISIIDQKLPISRYFSFLHRGAVCADSTDFDRCVKLWLHAMQLKEKQSSSNSMTKDVLRFAQVFCQMIHLGVDIGNNYAFKK